MRKTAVLAAALFLAAAPAFAGRVEWLDEDKDGTKEKKVTYVSGDEIASVEVDRNGDGKPDRFVRYLKGKRHTAEEDKNFDGRPDYWGYYTSKGILSVTAKDGDFDGRPEQFKKRIQGNQVVLAEKDRNGDGKIDYRRLAQWGVNRPAPGMAEIPGYRTVWREEDSDFDGIVDKYVEKDNPDAAKTRLGKPIDALPARLDEEKPSAPAAAPPEPEASDSSGKKGSRGAPVTASERRIRLLNEKYGYDDEDLPDV